MKWKNSVVKLNVRHSEFKFQEDQERSSKNLETQLQLEVSEREA